MILSEDFQLLISSLTKKLEVTDEVKDGIRLIQKFIKESKGYSAEDLYTKLSVDRTRLFRGVKPGYGPPPPYESIYVGDGSLMGNSTFEVMEMYKRVGVTLSEHWNEPVDYIGVELDFMRLLCAKEAEAWNGNDPNEALKYMKIEDEFLKEHVIKWVPRYCDNMFDEAKLDFYKGIAKVTKGFIVYDNVKMKDYIDVAQPHTTRALPKPRNTTTTPSSKKADKPTDSTHKTKD